jgi:hypothetical protein
MQTALRIAIKDRIVCAAIAAAASGALLHTISNIPHFIRYFMATHDGMVVLRSLCFPFLYSISLVGALCTAVILLLFKGLRILGLKLSVPVEYVLAIVCAAVIVCLWLLQWEISADWFATASYLLQAECGGAAALLTYAILEKRRVELLKSTGEHLR